MARVQNSPPVHDGYNMAFMLASVWSEQTCSPGIVEDSTSKWTSDVAGRMNMGCLGYPGSVDSNMEDSIAVGQDAHSQLIFCSRVTRYAVVLSR